MGSGHRLIRFHPEELGVMDNPAPYGMRTLAQTALVRVI